MATPEYGGLPGWASRVKLALSEHVMERVAANPDVDPVTRVTEKDVSYSRRRHVLVWLFVGVTDGSQGP